MLEKPGNETVSKEKVMQSIIAAEIMRASSRRGRLPLQRTTEKYCCMLMLIILIS